MKNFRNLEVWRLGHDLARRVYRLTSAFPREEQFSMTSQARRAAISIPANIAEGCGRGSNRDFSRFLQIAAGSASGLEYHLLLSRDLGFLAASDYESAEAHEIRVKKMLSALIRKVKADS